MLIYLIIMNFSILAILYVCGLFIQNISKVNKKSIFYGVSVPIGFEKHENLIKLHKEYQRNFNLSFIPLIIISTFIIANISEEISAILLIVNMFAAFGVITVILSMTHKKIMLIKKSEGWSLESKNVVIVDTSFRKKDVENNKIVISPGWFVIPLLIIFITIIGILGSDNKNYPTAMLFTMVQAFSSLTFFVAYKWTKKAKQSLNGGKIGELKNRSRKIRYFSSVGYLLFAIYTNLEMMLISFSICNIINPALINSNVFTIFSILLPVIIIAILVLAGVRCSKNEKYTPKTESEKITINRDDDEYYKLGLIYYNKADPALLVEKRMGIGMTINFAKPAAKVIMGIVLASILVPIIALPLLMPRMTQERQVDINQNAITISGDWGLKISKEEITKVTLENKLPKVIMKTDGADIGKKLFGMHSLEGYSSAALFLGDSSQPFVAIYFKDGRLVLINYQDKNKTNSLYKKIKNTMNIS